MKFIIKIKDLVEIVNNCRSLTKPAIFQSQKIPIKKISGFVVSQEVASVPEENTTDFFSHLDFNKMNTAERLFFTAMEQHISKDDIRTMMSMMPKKSNMPFLVQVVETIRLGKEKRR